MQIASKPVVEQAIRRGKIPTWNPWKADVLPGSKVVVNDGSTGVSSSADRGVHNKGIITWRRPEYGEASLRSGHVDGGVHPERTVHR